MFSKNDLNIVTSLIVLPINSYLSLQLFESELNNRKQLSNNKYKAFNICYVRFIKGMETNTCSINIKIIIITWQTTIKIPAWGISYLYFPVADFNGWNINHSYRERSWKWFMNNAKPVSEERALRLAIGSVQKEMPRECVNIQTSGILTTPRRWWTLMAESIKNK